MKPSHASLYEIRVEGELPTQGRDWFDGLGNRRGIGETRLSGPVTDQAALYGQLKKVRALGLTLVSVNRIGQTKENNP